MAFIRATVNSVLLGTYPRAVSDFDLLNAFAQAERSGRGFDNLMHELLGRFAKCSRLDDDDLSYHPLRTSNPAICALMSDSDTIWGLLSDLTLNNDNLELLLRTAMQSHPTISEHIMIQLSRLPKEVLLNAIEHLVDVFIETEQDPHILVNLLSLARFPEMNSYVLRLMRYIATRDWMVMLAELSAWVAVNDVATVPEIPPAELVTLWERIDLVLGAELVRLEPIIMNYVVMNFKFPSLELGKCVRAKKWKSALSKFVYPQARGARWRDGWGAAELWTNHLLPMLERACPMNFGALEKRIEYLRETGGEHVDTMVMVDKTHIVVDTLIMLELLETQKGTWPIFKFPVDDPRLVSNVVEWVTLVEANSGDVPQKAMGMTVAAALLNGIPILSAFTPSTCAAIASGDRVFNQFLYGVGLVVRLPDFVNMFSGEELCELLQRGGGDAILEKVLDALSDEALIGFIMEEPSMRLDVKKAVLRKFRVRMTQDKQFVSHLLHKGTPFVQAVLKTTAEEGRGVLEQLMVASHCSNPLVMHTLLGEITEYKIDEEGHMWISFPESVADAFVKLLHVYMDSCDQHVTVTVKSYHYAVTVLNGLTRCGSWGSRSFPCMKLFSEISVKLASYDPQPPLQERFVGLASYWETVDRKVQEVLRNRNTHQWKAAVQDQELRMGILSFVAVYPMYGYRVYCGRINRMRPLIDVYMDSAGNWGRATESVVHFWRFSALWHIERYCQTTSFAVASHIVVNRKKVLESSIRMGHLLVFYQRPRIVFIGEPGVDAGGLLREWYTLITKEFISPENGMFAEGSPNTYKIQRHNVVSPNLVEKMRFAGKVLGRAILDNQALGITFTRSVYKYLLGLEYDFEDLASEDPPFYKNLKEFASYDEESIASMQSDFTIDSVDDSGHTVHKELVPGGSAVRVTIENLGRYVAAVVEHKLAPQAHIVSFIEGFRSLIGSPTYTLEQLEALLAGAPVVSVDALIGSFSYDAENADGSIRLYGYTRNSQQVIWLHEQLRGYTQAELRSFLKFITGTDQVPFGGWTAVIRIVKEQYEGGRLPRAGTCFSTLYLPDYPDSETLAAKLKIAIKEGNEGFDRS